MESDECDACVLNACMHVFNILVYFHLSYAFYAHRFIYS